MDNNSILEKITEQYSAGMAGSKRASSIRKKIEQGTATYAQAEEMARECSRQLNKAFRDNLPDAVNNNFLYRETAEVVVRKPINQTAGDVADAAKKIQAALNEQAEIGMNPIVPELNEDQVDGIITGICNQPYSTGQNEFFSQVENLMEGYVDDFVYDNADFQYEAGLSPTIERTAVGKCCKWCDNLTGVYPYEKVQNHGNDVFRRHKNCHCQVLYNPGDGSKRRQNVHNRRWTENGRDGRISFERDSHLNESRQIASAEITNLRNEYVGRSLGAKYRNLDIMDLISGEKYHLTEGTYIRDKEVFAGKGTRTKYEKAENYAKKYGGKAEDWQHVKGFGSISTPDGDREVEIHWSQCEGIGKKELFIKKWLD